ncbi:unnamed protein product, partial [Heterosigma akashiwo]
MDYDQENVFAKIIDGKIPCYKVLETDHSLAFLDAFPAAEGHCLLIPKAKGYATLDSMPEDLAAAFLRDLPRLVKAVKDATGCEGVNIIQNNYAASGQEIFHVHFHIVPRLEGDRLLRHPPSAKAMVGPAAAAPVQEKIQQALQQPTSAATAEKK